MQIKDSIEKENGVGTTSLRINILDFSTKRDSPTDL